VIGCALDELLNTLEPHMGARPPNGGWRCGVDVSDEALRNRS